MKFKLNSPVKTSEICNSLGLDFTGEDSLIEGVASLDSQAVNFLSFSKDLSNKNNFKGVFCVPEDASNSVFETATIIPSVNPRIVFIKMLAWLDEHIGFSQYNKPSKISPTATISEGVVIEDGCEVGNEVVIEPNVTIHKGTIIGDNSIIRSNASIGSNGFGFEREDNGVPIRFPHLGRVVIGKDVEVGSCTAIARGTLGDTLIEDHVKIDNLVHIAHNARIKSGAFVIAGAEISGGVVVGENSWIAPNACTHQKISIGRNSIVGLGAVVTKDVDENVVVAGNPARKLKDLKP